MFRFSATSFRLPANQPPLRPDLMANPLGSLVRRYWGAMSDRRAEHSRSTHDLTRG